MNQGEAICLGIIALYLIFTCGVEILSLILALVLVGGILYVCAMIGEGFL